MTHPASCSDSQCTLSYREHLLSIHISAAALPNRKPIPTRLAIIDKQGEKDNKAYRALRKQGYQPPHIDGCDELQSRMTSPSQITPLGTKLQEDMYQRQTNLARDAGT